MVKKKKKATKKSAPKPGRNGSPVSLAPLTFDEAIGGLLQVPPERKAKEASRKKTPR